MLFVRGKYFVAFDELKTDQGHESSKFAWLYHIRPEVPVEWDRETAEFLYRINRTDVKVRHIANGRDLQFADRQGLDGMLNPVTGEDFRKYTAKIHFHFLTVIFPYPETEPEPDIGKLDDLTAQIEYGDSRDVISFDKDCPHHPDIAVDYQSDPLTGVRG